MKTAPAKTGAFFAISWLLLLLSNFSSTSHQTWLTTGVDKHRLFVYRHQPAGRLTGL
jgi:hypothetical protein